MPRNGTSAEIDAAAAEWAVRVDHTPLDNAEQAALDAWLSEDSRRRGAFARARAVLVHARRVKALGRTFDPDRYLALHPSDDRVDDHYLLEESMEPELGQPLRRRAILAGGAAILAAGTFAFVGPGSRAAAQTYSTRRGEIRLVPLPDGSTMTLNTVSTVLVSFADKERRIDLVGGEALFDVAKESGRPLNVYVGETVVRALGTSFTISRLTDRPVQLLVRQGSVTVDGPAVKSSSRIDANRRALFPVHAAIRISPVAPDDVTRELAWRDGMLSFEDETLHDVSSEFARYNATRILFADPTIGDETITGLYAANNPAGFAKSVSISLGLEVEVRPDAVTLKRAV